jgi:hypothetical protein
MDRHNTSILFNPDNNNVDRTLNNIKDILTKNYWANPKEGVFGFDFNSTTFTNSVAPFYFTLTRFTPTYHYEAFKLTIPGFVDSNGTIVYGGGRIGKLVNDEIVWNDNKSWKKIDNLPVKTTNLLNLNYVLDQSSVDSKINSVNQDLYYM